MKLLTQSKYLFFLAIILGLLLPEIALRMQFIVVPLLIIMMTVSIKDIAFRHITLKDTEEITGFVLLNYILLGGLYISLAFFLESPYKEAMIILGLMPPSVGVISLSKILHGNLKISFLTEFVSYAVAILLIPIASTFLFGEGFDFLKVLEVVVLIIIIPYILSRFIHNYETKHPKKHDYTKIIINICFSLTFFMIIGINREFIFDFTAFYKIYLILILLKFGFGTLMYYIFRHKLKKEDTVLLVLFSTFKNGGMAIAFTILLFGSSATIPFAINGITTSIYIVYLEWLLKK
ncbi:MAG: hypothetical protein ACMXX7_00870 [Candidatus Woesearchaeota archaeon]